MWNHERLAVYTHGKTLEMYAEELKHIAESDELYQKDMAVCVTALERILSDLRKFAPTENTEN